MGSGDGVDTQEENRTPARTGQNADQRLVRRRLDVGVVEDDERALAAELQRRRPREGRGRIQNSFAAAARPREAADGDARVRQQRAGAAVYSR